MTRSAFHAHSRAARFTISLAAAFALMLASAFSAQAAFNDGTYSYYTTADLCELNVTPQSATATVGAQQTFTATLTPIGPSPIVLTDVVEAGPEGTFGFCYLQYLDALEGSTVKFTVNSGPNAGKTEDAALNAVGQAKFNLTSATSGTDMVTAAIDLPDLCVQVYDPQEGPLPAGAISLPSACSDLGEQPVPVVNCGALQDRADTGCPTVTLSDDANVTWSAPVVEQSADPSLAIAARKRCVSKTFTIAPSYSGGEVKSSTLFIDAKKVQTHTASTAPFKVNAKRYKTGKHNYEVVTVFTSGKAASKFGSFTRCKVRTTTARVAPKFTG